MPVTKLLVEGELDVQLLLPIFSGILTVEAAMASKDALRPRTLDERKRGIVGVYYIRDRDYDCEQNPSPDPPVEEFSGDNELMGWRWRRHSMENYMLEPAIVCAALSVSNEDYLGKLLQAAQSLRYYQAARWTIGQIRNTLPPKYKLQTQDSNEEFYLPEPVNLAENSCREWVARHVETFSAQVVPALENGNVVTTYDRYVSLLNETVCGNPESVLYWFSGKNLMASLAGPLRQESPKTFRNKLRDWMRSHPEEVLSTLTEWRLFLERVRES